MKTFFTLFTLFFLLQVGFAQGDLLVKQDADASELRRTGSSEKAEGHSLAQSQSAIQQITRHISNNIEYPEIMRQYNYEGQVIVTVTISDTGRLQQAEVLPSKSKLFDDAVRKAISSLKKLKFQGNAYQGSRKISVPVKFSLR